MAAPKAGLPLWARVLLVLAGLAAVAAGAAAAFGGLAWWRLSQRREQASARRQADEAEQAARLAEVQAAQVKLAAESRPGWEAARAATEQLATDEGAKALYAASPPLHDAYPDEAAFLDAVRGLRAKLAPLPAEPPAAGPDYVVRRSPDGKLLILAYRNAKGAQVRYFLQGGQLAEVQAN